MSHHRHWKKFNPRPPTVVDAAMESPVAHPQRDAPVSMDEDTVEEVELSWIERESHRNRNQEFASHRKFTIIAVNASVR